MSRNQGASPRVRVGNANTVGHPCVHGYFALVTDEKHSRTELEIGNQFGDIARMTGLATLHRRVLALTSSTQCLLILTSQSFKVPEFKP